jgi:RES domain-containing protein
LKILAWRITKPGFAKSVDDMLSGEGAYLNGGRWNSEGTRMVYLASSLSLAAMETLVHTNAVSQLNTFSKLPIRFEASLARRLDVSDLPEHWNELTLDPVTQEIGDDWIESASSAFLMVPSVTIPEEMIYLMNPQHDDVEKAIAGEITPFIFDPRLS